MLKIRGISGIKKLDDVKVPLTHPVTGEVFGHLFANVKNLEEKRQEFSSENGQLKGAPYCQASLKSFCTGWDFVDDETGDPLVFDLQTVLELSRGVGVEWVGAPFVSAIQDTKNFYSKPNKT